ncbi:TetR family transcriptional regulator OS=Streptomyces rimosus subsp. rimosus (strain ATCC /DSM 40260 / JCM 4667 / NRRL 2234) OX=1265868 GN=SRIM_005730 PE=4 SV=1 [Streptomyces rimosus subsp. rimosus]
MLVHLTNVASHDMPELTPAQGADLVSQSLFQGVGAAPR